MLFSHASRLTATTCHCRLQPPFQRCGIWAQIPSFGSSPPRSAGAAAPNASLPPAGLNPLVQCESVHVHFDLVDSISVACRFLVPGQYVCVLMCVHMYLYIDMCLCVRCVQRVGQSINQLTYQLSNCVCARVCLFEVQVAKLKHFVWLLMRHMYFRQMQCFCYPCCFAKTIRNGSGCPRKWFKT